MLFDSMTNPLNTSPIQESFADENVVVEAFIVDEVSHLPESKIREFCESGGLGEQLVQEGKLKNKTLVRLSKKDDLSRRTKMGALLLAKEANDPLYKKLVINRAKKKELIEKIMQKYGHKGEKVAKQAQAEYLKGGKKAILPKSFMQAGGEDR